MAGLAAAVGTNFTLDLLTEASDLEADTVVEAVDELWRRRIMREFGDGYDFSHDLLREAAYAEVSPPKRWLLHRRIAQGLELLHADDTDAVAAQLAEQYARGGRGDRALAYYRRAADVAAGRFAHAEAIRLHREALSIIAAMPAGRDRDSHELAVLEAMAAPLNARHGYSSPDLQQALERSIALAESLGRKDSTVTGLVALWASQFVQGRTADGYQTASRALALVDPGSELSGQAHFAVGGSAVSLGRPAEGLRHLELAAELAGGAVSLSIGTRPDVHGTAWAAHAHWLLGHDDEALSACREAIRLARAIDDPYSLAVALAYGSITHQMRHDLPGLRETVGELRELCDRYGFAYYREWGLILDGWSAHRTCRASTWPGGASATSSRRARSRACRTGCRCSPICWPAMTSPARHAPPSTPPSPPGRPSDDVWWLPEVMRMRAALRRRAGRHLAAALRGPGRRRLTAASRCSGAASVTSKDGAFAVPAPGVLPTA